MSCCSSRWFSILLCCLGASLAAYSLHVEHKWQEAAAAAAGTDGVSEYKPLCDIDEKISCSKAFNSDYAVGMGVLGDLLGQDHVLVQPNALLGLFFYGILTFLALFNFVFFARLQFYLAFLSNLSSIWLGYVLYFVLETLCVICVSIYAVNFLLTLSSYFRLRALQKSKAEKALREASGLGKQQAGKRTGGRGLPTTVDPKQFKKNI